MSIRDAVKAALRLLDRRDRRLLALATMIQIAVSLLDLLGVVILGGVGALVLSAVQRRPPPKPLEEAVTAVGLGGMSGVALIATLAGSAAILLLAKSAISPYAIGRVLRFLANREALVSARLTGELLNRPLTFVRQRSTHETNSALIRGTNKAVVVLGQAVTLVVEVSLLTALGVTLLVVNPLLAIGVIVYFAIIGAILHKVLGVRSEMFGRSQQGLDVATSKAIAEAINVYREITVADRRMLYVSRIQRLRAESAAVAAGSIFVAILPKFVYEAALVLGAFVLAGTLFATQSPPVAAGMFLMFLVAAARIMPSLSRLQNAALVIRNAAGTAAPAFTLADELGNPLGAPSPEIPAATIQRLTHATHTDFTPHIQLRGVTFTYPGAATPALRHIDVSVRAGQSVALVGRSGAGKSTLADVILGVIQPDSGEVRVGGLSPSEAIRNWPGGIAYVPQDVTLTDESVRANVTVGLPPDSVDDTLVWEALEGAHLAEYVRREPDGLDTRVRERGSRLSGGQRQRLGIARALFTHPRLIVLDEATSALDAETEAAITASLEGLDHSVTKVIIAHRLSTIRRVDLVCYLDEGRVLATGTFDEVRRQIPAFERQAAMMGLRDDPGT